MGPPLRKRRASVDAASLASKRSTREPPSINKALPKQRTRPLSTAAAVEAAARAKKRNDAPQSNIGFQKKDQYSIGMKLLLDESIYEKQNEVSYNLLSLYCNLFLGCLIQLTIIYFFPSQVPEEARGFLFEYQLIKVCRLGATIQYSNRMITPKGDKFCTFEETEDVQTMVLQLDERFKESHDLWQKANGRQNARTATMMNLQPLTISQKVKEQTWSSRDTAKL